MENTRYRVRRMSNEMKASKMNETLLTVEEVATFLDIPKASLYSMNYTRTGPKFLKVGKYCRYRASDLNAWLQRKEVNADEHEQK